MTTRLITPRRGTRGALLTGVLSAVVLALAVAWLPAVPANAAGANATPTLAVTPNRGPCDGRFVVQGRGFAPGEETMVYVRPEYVPRTSPPAGFEVRADAAGNINAEILPGLVSCLPSRAPGGEQPHEALVPPDGRPGYRATAVTATFAASPSPRRCFPETGHCVAGRFLAYWQTSGGLAINGYPLSDVFVQRLEDGREYAVQYFERVRLEAHEEVGDVLLGQFGRRILATVPNAPTAPVPPAGGTRYSRHFPETGHNMAGRFLAYWELNGDLRHFGYPLTEEFEQRLEDGKVYLVQYFERARFEYHPENPVPYDVLLGQFGRRILAETTGGPNVP